MLAFYGKKRNSYVNTWFEPLVERKREKNKWWLEPKIDMMVTGIFTCSSKEHHQFYSLFIFFFVTWPHIFTRIYVYILSKSRRMSKKNVTVKLMVEKCEFLFWLQFCLHIFINAQQNYHKKVEWQSFYCTFYSKNTKNTSNLINHCTFD